MCLDLDNACECRLIDDYVVQDATRLRWIVTTPQLDCKHDPSIEAEVSSEDRLECRVKLFNTKLREITESAVVDAENGNFLIANHSRGGDHGAVTAENEHQVDLARELLLINLRNRAAGLVLDPLALEVWPTDERDASLRKPHDQFADGFQCLGLVRFKNYSYPLD